MHYKTIKRYLFITNGLFINTSKVLSCHSLTFKTSRASNPNEAKYLILHV